MDLIVITKNNKVIFYRDVKKLRYGKYDINFSYGNPSDSFTGVCWTIEKIKEFRVIENSETKVEIFGELADD